MGRARMEVWDPAGTHYLRTKRGLPVVKLRGGTRASLSNLVDAAGVQLGLDVVFLRDANNGVVVMESLAPGPQVALPRGLQWESARPSSSRQDGTPWTRPGWFGQVLPVIDQALAQQGVRRIGAPVQRRHGELGAVLRIPTTRGNAWFKTAPPVFACEGPVIDWLARVAPQAVPTVIATGPTWWISADFPPEADDPQGHPFETLARIQMATASRTSELLELGCPYRGLDQLVQDLAALAERLDLLKPVDAAFLRSALPGVEKVCTKVEALDIPYTVVHGDFRYNNVRWTSHGWFVYDWSDTCVAHPFVDTEDRDIGSWHTETPIFGAVWSEAVAPQTVDCVQKAARVICAAHRTATFQRIVDSVRRPTADPIIPLLEDCIHRLVGTL